MLLQTCRDQEQRERILGIISNAQYNLGEMWASGKGVARVDTIKATQYFKAAADNQHVTARYMMGYYYHHGITMSKTEQPRKNIDQAIEWYTLAAEQGHDKAQAALGTFLLNDSTDLAIDHERAIMHLTRAANAGHAQAQRALGTMYEQGLGFSCADEHQAHTLFTKAAAQGDVLALGSLGKQYEYGRGCIRDTTKATQCYRRAADTGY
ncbi:HCP-like protein, partial [Lichtheimia hyalospora FSU 10163]